MATAAECNVDTCKNVSDMTADEIWMRDPIEQCSEGFSIYNEISEFVFDKIKQMQADFIVAEGAAFTPEVMDRIGYDKYITIIWYRFFVKIWMSCIKNRDC